MTLDALRERIGALLAGGPVRLAVLFGSYAEGTADAWSDVDLLLVAPTDRSPPERWRDFDLLVREIGPVDLFVYTPEEWERSLQEQRPFACRVDERGVVVYRRPPA